MILSQMNKNMKLKLQAKKLKIWLFVLVGNFLKTHPVEKFIAGFSHCSIFIGKETNIFTCDLR